MKDIISVNNKTDYLLIEKLADTIWREYYTSMISLEQIDYMLKRFNSVTAIENEIKEGALFFYVSFNNIPVGYLAIKKETNYLFLMKIYLLKDFRGKGLGKEMMRFVEEKARNYNLQKIRLTVNINNINSIKAYEKMGFVNVGPLVTDIGNGFVMDDYEMVKKV